MKTIHHKFVEFIPDILEEGVLYISIDYCTAVHLCICGCGNEVVTPISPNDWELWFNGKTVSLYPSIGNWSFECKSHYFITKNKIRNARQWEDWEIKYNRVGDFNEQPPFKRRRKQNRKKDG
jgi:hypothetical protein